MRGIPDDVPASITRAILSLALLARILSGISPACAAEAAPPRVGTITSIQNLVETKPRAGAAWTHPVLDQPLYGFDHVRTGPASRAAILYPDRTLQRMDQKSEIEIQPATADQPGLLRVLTGTYYYSSRAPREYRRIDTPTVSAYVKGTEFIVEVAENTTTTITMLEGTVEATNTYGTLTVQKGEQAYVEPGKAPVRRIVIRPRDAVAWALYYPPVLGGRDAQRLKALGKDGEDLTRAAGLLASGQVNEARALIEEARARRPRDPVALALAAVIKVATNDKEEALQLAEAAVAADPDSAAAALALSFAAQARFDIARARALAEKAAELDPSSTTALARAAELRMAEGDLGGAREAADEAVRRAPDEARALSVLGFVELAQYRSAEAELLFERAVSSDSTLALARLGLGLARIRRGRVETGREELQVATALDPDDSLLRSYLAKALYEEKLGADAAKELAEAKELDPRDPTPYLYDAIRKQNDNRPVEALEDLRASIARNDNRAVYRSRLLLDQDRAVRGSDLARIYNDLGFDALGLVTARRSADEDQANFSSHLFLAGNYRNVPGFAPAFLSEVLQARIYQPVSVNAARPDVVNESASFNEYTALLDRPRARGFGTFTYGRTDTDLGTIFTDEAACLDDNVQDVARVSCRDRRSLRRSALASGELNGTLNRDRFAGAFGYSKLDDDGFRLNNDRTIVNYRAFFQYAPTDRDSLQLNALLGRQDTGDVPVGFDTTNITRQRLATRLVNVGLGYHHSFSPAANLAVSVIENDTRQTSSGFLCRTGEPGCERVFSRCSAHAEIACAADADCPAVAVGETCMGGRAEIEVTLQGPQLEVQQVLKTSAVTWVVGAGAFRGVQRLAATSGGARSAARPPALRADDSFTNAYAYATIRRIRALEITLGASAERVVVPAGILVPNGAQVGPSELGFSQSRWSPKLGVSVFPTRHTVLRGAVFQRLSPAIGRIQTLEPTQVAGFNQFFSESGGTRSHAHGVGLDQDFGARIFAGFAFVRRTLDIPEASCRMGQGIYPEFPCQRPLDPDGNLLPPRPAGVILSRRSKTTDISAYANAVISRRMAFSAEYLFQKRDFDTATFITSAQTDTLEDHVLTRRVHPALRWFLPGGLFATAEATYYAQEVNQILISNRQRDPGTTANQRFWIEDLSIGYRLPQRYGSILLRARNAGDRAFERFEREVEDTVIPARLISLTLSLAY